MGFHRRHIDNDQVIRLYENGGLVRIKEWYTRGVDALVTETGLASQVGSILSDDDWIVMGTQIQEKEIIKLIQKHLGIVDSKK
jgi:hypothetical protein|tara:strand:+ start:282 stop:530 length:249 start_codon:yes stop_codon:yes gene_type:complete